LLWLEVLLLYQGHSFLEFHVMYFLSSHFYVKFSRISCDYKFCVFLHQDISIQQLLCFHIRQSRILNKLDNLVLEFFYTFNINFLRIRENFHNLVLKLICIKSNHKVRYCMTMPWGRGVPTIRGLGQGDILKRKF
jgi:hypothetical protein